jgi:hypothetical protein
MTKKARIAAALSAPVAGALAAIAVVAAPAATAAAASPITVVGNAIIISLEPLLHLTIWL